MFYLCFARIRKKINGPVHHVRERTARQPARRRPAQPRPAGRQAPRPWTKSQERLALLYNEQGKRPEEIAEKLGLSRYIVTQIILGSRNRGKL